jgi:hypothetical protein
MIMIVMNKLMEIVDSPADEEDDNVGAEGRATKTNYQAFEATMT